MSRSALLAMVVGGNLAGVGALAAMWWLERHDLIVGPPAWVFMAMIVASMAADVAARHLVCAPPRLAVRVHVRVIIAVGSTAVILYSAGWGPLFSVGYVLAAVHLLSQLRGIDWRLVLGWVVLGVAAGELAVHAGIAPTMVTVERSHMVAIVGLVLLAAVLWVVGGILRRARRGRTGAAIARAATLARSRNRLPDPTSEPGRLHRRARTVVCRR